MMGRVCIKANSQQADHKDNVDFHCFSNFDLMSLTLS